MSTLRTLLLSPSLLLNVLPPAWRGNMCLDESLQLKVMHFWNSFYLFWIVSISAFGKHLESEVWALTHFGDLNSIYKTFCIFYETTFSQQKRHLFEEFFLLLLLCVLYFLLFTLGLSKLFATKFGEVKMCEGHSFDQHTLNIITLNANKLSNVNAIPMGCFSFLLVKQKYIEIIFS